MADRVDDLVRTCAAWGDPRLPDRFWKKAVPEPNSGCWIWAGWTTRAVGGYGGTTIGRTKHLAHRVSYEALVGEIPDGLEIDHLCRTRLCVNPSHLEPVTPSENVLRGLVPLLNSTKTHCKYGHEFSHDNTRIVRHADGTFNQRACRTCARDRYYANKET